VSSRDSSYRQGSLDKNDFLKEVYNRYGKKLYSYAICTWKVEEDDAWDLIYKTLEKVVESYTNYTFETEGKFASFIFRVFINNLRNHYRANKRLPVNTSLNDHDGAEMPLQEKEHSVNPKLKALNDELEKMEDWQRMLLLMRSEGWSYADIAKYVDKPENQLKVYYQRLKEQLSKKLHERIND
jgi:RNA polymerase sigma-70 factor (ECF subfamily)